jgi:probable O-glycosylation ligase (exosortase A-associated)
MKGLFFTYSLTYGGAVVSVFYPFIGLLIYICFSIIKPPAMWYWSVPIGNYDRIIGVAMLLGWVIKGTGNWRLGRATAVVLCLAAFHFWGIVGWAGSDVPSLAQLYVEQQTKTVLPFLVGITLISSLSHLKQIAWVIALSSGYLAYELNYFFYCGYNRVQEEGFGGMDNNCVAVAMVTAVGVSMFLGFAERRIWLKALAFLSAVLSAHVVMFAFSRGGMLGLVSLGVVAFLIIPREPKHYLIFALLLILAFRLAGTQVRDRFMSAFVDPEERDLSANTRLEMWGYCIQTMKKSPVLGCGPNHWMIQCERLGARPILAHSIWLQCGAELGIPGLALLLAFYGTCVARLWPLTRRKAAVADPWLSNAGRMVIASIAGFAVAGSFVSLVGLELPYYVVLLGAGVLKVASTSPPPEPPGEHGDEPIAENRLAVAGQM